MEYGEIEKYNMHKGQFSESYYLYLGISCSRAYTAIAESFLPLLQYLL
jgi:hypothetical protein